VFGSLAFEGGRGRTVLLVESAKATQRVLEGYKDTDRCSLL
jgi:hypothetical protein